MKIADISIKRPVFITVIMIALTVIGALSYTKLPLNDQPAAEMPYVTVTITERGASPEQLESKVTKKVEDAVGQISGVKHVTSTITDGVSNTAIEFALDKSADVAAQEVRDKVSGILRQLPSDVDEPTIVKFDPTAQAIVSVAVTGGDNKEISTLVEDVIQKKLNAVKGVGAVNVYGSVEREIQIKLDKDKMEAYGITTDEVVTSLRNDNLEMSAGKVSDENREISLKTNSNIKRVEDFKNILVTKRSNAEIRVGDIAKVIDGNKDKDSLSFYQGKQAIGIDIVKQSGSNTVEVGESVKKEISNIQNTLPKGVSISIVRDNSISIRNTVDEVIKTIIEGCILAVIIVFLFLNEWESTVISAISLPISIITTFTAMKFMNFSLNTMSLMAMSLAVGLLIDDAIVVIENIVRHLHKGKGPLEAARDATSEIGFAVLATTLAVVSVFLPVATVEGIIGKYFIEFGLTIVFSMLVSLFVSFTLVPMLSSKILKGEKKRQRKKTFLGKFMTWFNAKFDQVAEKYASFLGFALHHRLIVLILAAAMFLGSIALVPSLGISYIPSTDQGEINISAELDSGLTLEAAEKKAKEIEDKLSKYKEVNYVYTTVKKDKVSVFVKLMDKNKRKDGVKAVVEKMRGDLKHISGMEVTASAASMGGGGKDVSLNIVGEDYEQLQAVALKAKAVLSQDPHARDVGINYKAGKPETKLDIDRDKAADLGVSTASAGNTLNTLFNGVVVSKFDNGKNRYDVKVSIDDEQSKNLDSLKGIYVTGSANKMVSLEQVTRKVFSTASSSLHRYDRMGQVEISANVNGVAVGDFNTQTVKKLTSELQLPKGVTIKTGGTNSTMADGMMSLLIALVMGILFLYLVMAAQFESFIDPIAIMFTLPLALIGAILGLFVFRSELSIMAIIGVIMLMGLVAKNGILLVDFAKQKATEGAELREALKEAGLVRLRPILMTTLAMIFGMIPLAVAKGAGTEMRAPMAQAVIGGLITSTILTLFVVPTIYTLLDDLKKLFKKRFSSDSQENKIVGA